MASPFVQGQLRNEPITCSIHTECAHCGRPLQLEVNSDLTYRLETEGAAPLLFVPVVDFSRLKGPSIIDDF